MKNPSKKDSGNFLKYEKISDQGTWIQFSVKTPAGERYTIKTHKNFKASAGDFTTEERKRLLLRDFNPGTKRSFVFPFVLAHIGDAIMGFEMVLALRQFLAKRGRFEFHAAIKKNKRVFYERFLGCIPIFDTQLDHESLSKRKFRYPTQLMPLVRRSKRVDHVALGDYWEFYWARWGLPGRYLAADTTELLKRFDKITTAEHAKLRKALGWPTPAQYVVFFPESAEDGNRKLWPMAHWIELINKVLASTRLSVVVCATMPDLKMFFRNEPRVVVYDYKRVPTGVRADLLTLSTLIAKAKAVVSLDTGPAHVSGFLKKTCIVLFGSTTPVFVGHRNNLNVRVSACPPCHWRPRSYFCIDNVCMKEIKASEIFELLKQTLEKKA